ncbi:uncharacterized protein LOC116167664 [Photinus pyralis]|uniref:uncharacterized protein LOC116167664 n=1 Tax=Photinus pyralis TaxID=7054 RepID=UPI0012675671|nr:uncharacterized protein LOC116167664 [Photinus pyralis]
MSAFLNDFVTEAVDLIQNGCLLNMTNVIVRIIGFVCDAPAKSDVLGVKGHSGYSSCTRCTVVGETRNHRRIFLETNCAARTNSDFINWIDPSYRLHDTSLVKIPNLDFVNGFVLDYMHLVCLGVMRTLIVTWYSGDLPHRLSFENISTISNNLLQLVQNTPTDFVRKPREIKYVLRWKATEFRMFLLYFGPVVLKGVLDPEKYNNFITLHVAISILCNTFRCKDKDQRQYARCLLINFIKNVQTLYSPDLMTHNFHGLIHLTDDADYFIGKIPDFSLDSISAFPFENYMQQIKRMNVDSYTIY